MAASKRFAPYLLRAMTLKAFCFSARLYWPWSLMPHSWEIRALPSPPKTSTWASRSQSIQKFAPSFIEP